MLAENTGRLSDIGEPVDGAVEFTRRLSESADIVILTSRLARDKTPSAEHRKMVLRIEDWLEEHGFAYSRVHTGLGKPPASAYVDDRAVACRPKDDGIVAFDNAIELVEQLTR